jgi:Integrase core domain
VVRTLGEEIAARIRSPLFGRHRPAQPDACPASNTNAFDERWVRTVRSDCLDRILILGRRHLDRVLGIYRRHYNEHRPHRALQLMPPPNGADTLAAEYTTLRSRSSSPPPRRTNPRVTTISVTYPTRLYLAATAGTAARDHQADRLSLAVV